MNVTKRKRKNETDICWSLSFCWRILGTYLEYGYSWLQDNDIVTNLDKERLVGKFINDL